MSDSQSDLLTRKDERESTDIDTSSVTPLRQKDFTNNRYAAIVRKSDIVRSTDAV